MSRRAESERGTATFQRRFWLFVPLQSEPPPSVCFNYRPKSSFLPSYIIDVRELDEKLLNIIDMKFLHGYYEPTLLILFEPNQTWPG